MSCRRKCSSESLRKLNVKSLCARKLNAKNAKIINADITNLTVDNLVFDGNNLNCTLSALNSPAIVNVVDTIQLSPDVGGTGPIKPANVNIDVWNALLANADLELTGLKARILQGREDIIAEQNYPQSVFVGSISGNVLTVISLTSGNLGVGQYLFPDPDVIGAFVAPGTMIMYANNDGTFLVTISQNITFQSLISKCSPVCPPLSTDVDMHIYGYDTKPLLTQSTVNCGTTGSTSTTSRVVNSMNYNLDVYYKINETHTDTPRVVTVLCQLGYKEAITGNTVVETLFIGNRQFYPTLDLTRRSVYQQRRERG